MNYKEVLAMKTKTRFEIGEQVGLMHDVQDVMMSDKPYIEAVGEAMLKDIICGLGVLEVRLKRYEYYLSTCNRFGPKSQQVAPFIFDCVIGEEEIPF